MILTAFFIHNGWKRFEETALTAEAVITHIEYDSDADASASHDVYVEYTVDGNSYESLLGYYSSRMTPGDNVTVYYSPSDPSAIRAKTPVFIYLIMLLFVLIFGGIGTGFLLNELRRYRLSKRLLEKGEYIYCDDWTEKRSSLKVNNVRYRVAECTYTDPFGQKHIFTSEPYHPSRCPYFPGQRIKVYVDIENAPKKYFVAQEE